MTASTAAAKPVRVAPGVYRLPSGSYRGNIMRGGIRQSRTFPSKALAVAYVAGIEASAEAGEVQIKRGAMTFGAFWSDFDLARCKPATRRKRRAWWASRIEERWATVPMRSVTGPALDMWTLELERDGLAESTIRTIIYVVSAMYREAKRHRYVERNPVDDMDKRPKIVKRAGHVLTDAEFEAMLANVDPHPWKAMTEHRAREIAKTRGMLVVMRETGARIGEMVVLTRAGVRDDRIVFSSHYDEEGTLGGLKGKDDEHREAPLTEYLRSYLEPLLDGLKPSDLVFPSPRNGGPYNVHNWRARVWWPIVNRAGIAAPDRSGPLPHDLRRTFATYLGDAGVPVHKMRDGLGHSDDRSLSTYLRTEAATLPVELAQIMDARRAKSSERHLHAV